MSTPQSGVFRSFRVLLVALSYIVLAAVPFKSVSAELLPEPHKIVLPSERPVLEELTDAAEGAGGSSQALLPIFDKALGKLREPTALRGLVQFTRATFLNEMQRRSEAIDAVEESIRLLPDYSAPLMLASSIYTYADRPGLAADYLLRASRKDPGAVRNLPDYDFGALLMRLRAAREDRRAAQLSERLLEIGWVTSSVDRASSLALEVIRQQVRDNEIERARALVPKLLVPNDSFSLLVDKRYQRLWPDIETWGGPKLVKQWAMYLSEARERWTASRDPEMVRTYSLALSAAGHDDTVLREILPLFKAKLEPGNDEGLITVTSGVAGALARKGRWDEVDALFAGAQKVWPLGSQANALNIAANQARYLLYADKPELALAKIDEALADADRWGGEVNSDALALMHHYRACMLHQLGRKEQAVRSINFAKANAEASEVAGLYLCLGDPDSARQTLLNALAREETRGSVLRFIQPEVSKVMQSKYARWLRASGDALRSDPVLLAEAAKYGRVLPYRLNDGAPAEAR